MWQAATGRVDPLGTAAGAARYVRGLPRLVRTVEDLLEEEAFDLAITDFEPSLPRAAQRRRVPLLSVSHQHFLLSYDLRCLPWGLRLRAAYMRWIVRAYYSNQAHTVVSSFYFPPLRAGCRNVTQVGVLLRPELRRATPEREDYFVAYLRRFAPPRVLEQTGAGRWMGMDQVVPEALREFERRLDDFAPRIERRRLDGLPATLRVIEQFLPASPAPVDGRTARLPANRRGQPLVKLST